MQNISEIFSQKKVSKAPAYQWQDLALRVIQQLGIPSFKRSSVFKACRDNDRNFIEKCLDDTKELAKGSESWRYFFKLIDQKDKPQNKLPQ